MTRRPNIVEVAPNSLDDGPGVRSVVFFKGCPLRCDWCQNPEAISSDRELRHDVQVCIGCEACREACTTGAAQGSRANCRVCGACVEACPSGARSLVGRRVDGEELAELLLRDEPFFRASGGGVTLSGGEPTLHLDLAADVASRLRGRGVHVLLETCGHFPYAPFAERLLPHLDVIYLDLKIVDPALHERHTGKSNGRVLGNLRKLAALAAPELLVRLPLVPRVTATDDNVRAVTEVVRGLGLERLALLPYNPLWLDKARALGKRTAYDNEKWMTDAEVERCREIVRDGGLAPL